MELIEIGKIRKPHGLKGEMRIEISEYYLEDLLQCATIFLDMRGQHIPYFVKGVRKEAIPPILALEDVDSKEIAAEFRGKAIFIRKEDLISPEKEYVPEDELHFGYLKDYHLYKDSGELVGTLIRIEAFPQQEIATVLHEGKEVMIPLHPALILVEDQENKKITMTLPEGLLNI
jgi:16S rRNA processing protein RimM